MEQPLYRAAAGFDRAAAGGGDVCLYDGRCRRAAGEMGFYLFNAGRLEETAQDAVRLSTISELVAVVDGYLLAAIMLIFALGIYELFVNKINEAEGSEFASRLLLIRSLDDLKDRLANVILLILIVKFFQQALNLKYVTVTDLLSLSIGIILIAGALFLTSRAKNGKDKGEKMETAVE